MQQYCPVSDKHLLLMRYHSMDKETMIIVDDFVKTTDFYVRLGIKFLYLSEMCNCATVIFW